MSILSLDHVNIATAQLKETRDFYCDVLGLTEGYRPAFAVAGYWLYVDDQPIVHLQQASDDEGRLGPVRHFALCVASLDEVTKLLDRADVAYRRTQTPDGVFEQVFLRDPSGAQLELICRRPSA